MEDLRILAASHFAMYTSHESQHRLYKEWLRYTLYCGAIGGFLGTLGYGVWGYEAPVDRNVFGFLYYHITGIAWSRIYSSLLSIHLEQKVNSLSGTISYTLIRIFPVVAGHALVGSIIGLVLSPIYMCFKESLSKKCHSQ